jgi:SAM-dependent methyltransferase
MGGLTLGEEQYLFSDAKDKEELDRLTLQASFFDPVTTRHLDTIGVVEGWKCLEVGAGTGSIAQWLSSRVGPTGRVVATDIDLRFLGRVSAPNLELRRHDILKDNLEKDEYDLVHCRKMLHHLREPEKAVTRMADTVRPGGWLLLEEDDHGSRLSLDVANPSLATIVAACRAQFDFLRKSGLVDFFFGRRVRGLVEQLGYVDIGHEGWTCMARGGDPMALVDSATVPILAKPMIDAGLLTREGAETFQRLYLDPNFYYPFYTLFREPRN